jgi:hypothetical protein
MSGIPPVCDQSLNRGEAMNTMEVAEGHGITTL